MSHDAAQLLARSRRGDEAAAVALWEAHGPRLIAYVKVLLHDPHGAEDVVQQVFIEALRAPSATVGAVKDVPAWLTWLARQRAANHLRACARRARAERREARNDRAGERPRERASEIDALPRRAREVLVLRHGSGLTFAQIALALGVAASTAAARYEEAVRLLKDRMGSPEVTRG